MSAGPSDVQGGQQLVVGKILLERGLLSAEQLREALAERARRVSSGEAVDTSLGAILVEKGYLSGEELTSLLSDMKEPAARPAVERDPFTAPDEVASAPPSAPSYPDAMTRLGKYSLVRELGRGGMGIVYEALDEQLNRKVALKLLLPVAAMDPKELQVEEERFTREAQLAAKLKHPNIVTVYEGGILEGRQFIAMELIEGKALSDWWKESQLPLRQQVQVLRDAALAVHYAHEQGILHRDLKPRNILMGSNQQPYVSDFGLAKTLGKNSNASLTGQGMVVGTPAYMSPEQAQGSDKVDWRTDIYSLGVILYETLTGQTPFTGDSPIEILMKVVKDPPRPPSHVASSERAMALDRTIENITLKALAKSDSDRYVTAKAFADDLTQWIEGHQIKIVLPRQKKGRSSLWIYAAAVMVTLLGVGGMYLYLTLSVSVRTELAAAKEFMDKGLYDEALEKYTEALARDPQSAEAAEGKKKAREGKDRQTRQREDALRTERDKHKKDAEEALSLAARIAEAEKKATSEAERVRFSEERKAFLEQARIKEAAAEKADARLRSAGLGKSPSGAPGADPDDPWSQGLGILSLVVPARDAVWGQWATLDGILRSDRTRAARLQIPFELPEEYDLRVEFSRTGGTEGVSLYVSQGGRTFTWTMGAAGNTFLGFGPLKEGEPEAATAGLRSTRCLDNDRKYLAMVQVRRDGLKAFLDDQPLCHWKTGTSAGLPAGQGLRHASFAGLGSDGSPAAFYRVELLEKTGKGRAVEEASIPEFKALPVDASELKPGLIGEYYYGTDFESLAVRRIDLGVAFHWLDGAPWKDGPRDAFSCRWSGYLHVPRTGRYVFSMAHDDGARLVLDGVQIMCNWAVKAASLPDFECVLERGHHAIILEHFDRLFEATMVLSWAESGLSKMAPVGSKSMFHRAAEGLEQEPTAVPENSGVLTAHSDSITCLAFSANGEFLATASEDRRVRVWDVKNRKESRAFSGHALGTQAVAFSPDGRLLASGGYDRKIKLWDLVQGSEAATLAGHTDFVGALVFGHDGKLLFSGGNDGTIRVWSTSKGTLLRTMVGHGAGVTALALSPDGRELASASMDHSVRLWDADTGGERGKLLGHADWVEAVVYSPDGKRIATGSWDYLSKVWDALTGREILSLPGHHSEVMSVAFSPDGSKLVSAGNDAVLRVWELPSGKELRTLAGHGGQVLTAAFQPGSGNVLASGGVDGTVRFWSLDPK